MAQPLPAVRAPGADPAKAVVSYLERYEPEYSARTVITRRQATAFAGVAVIAALALVAAPQTAGAWLSDGLAGWFFANAAFRAVLFGAGIGVPRRPAAPPLTDDALPGYSILVPLYREANVLPALVRALGALDYPGIR